MAFDDRDISTPRIGNKLSSVEEVTFRRNRSLSGIQLEVIVYRNVDGERTAKTVPQAKVDAGWPGGAKSLKNHLLAAIDNAE